MAGLITKPLVLQTWGGPGGQGTVLAVKRRGLPTNDVCLNIKEANRLETKSLTKCLLFKIVFLSTQVARIGEGPLLEVKPSPL